MFMQNNTAVEPGSWTRGEGERDWPGATALGRLAVRRMMAGDCLADTESIHRMTPVYLRVSEAERRYGRKKAP